MKAAGGIADTNKTMGTDHLYNIFYQNEYPYNFIEKCLTSQPTTAQPTQAVEKITLPYIKTSQTITITWYPCSTQSPPKHLK